MINDILEKYDEHQFIIIDGFDDAIIGVDESKMILIYSVKKCIEILMEDMSCEDALEYFYYNTYNAYISDKQPMFCDDNFIY